MMFCQRTIKETIRFEGIGLHSGGSSSVILCPAPANTGIVFIVDGKRVPASFENVSDTSLATSISAGEGSVRTIEHLMSAVAGLCIDNIYIEITGPEVPIMDGSARQFVNSIREAGIDVQPAPRRYLKVLRPIKVTDGDKSAEILPSSTPQLTCRIDFGGVVIAEQSLSMEINPSRFANEIANARTFGFLKDVQMLRKAGLALGGSLENAVVIDGDKVMNEEGLRYPDEFVRHKMLDAIGDIALLGLPFIGHVIADKSGHKLNHKLVCEIMARPECWMIVEGDPATRPVESVNLCQA